MVMFSLIIPVAPGREADIRTSIGRLDYPASGYEVLIIRGSNPSANRNRGARQARGDILVFLDDDAAIPADYLRQAEAFFAQHPAVDIVGGPQLTSEEDRGFSKISWYALSSIFGAWKVSNRYAVRKARFNVDETAVSSANLLCRRQVLEKIAFDTRLFPGEDPKFIADARKAGYTIAYSPTILLYHHRRPTIVRLIQQIFSYGKTRPQKETLRDTLKMPFFFAPSLFLFYLLGLGCLAAVKPQLISNTPTGAVVFSPLLTYVLSAIFFGIYDALKHRDIKAVFFLPFIYPVIHISYGAGMVWGYCRKMVRRPVTGIMTRSD